MRAYASVLDVRRLIGRYLDFKNRRSPLSSLGGRMIEGENLSGQPGPLDHIEVTGDTSLIFLCGLDWLKPVLKSPNSGLSTVLSINLP